MATIPFSPAGRRAAVLCVLLSFLPSCADLDPIAVIPEQDPVPEALLQAMTCEGSLASNSVTCRSDGGSSGGISAALIGGQNVNVRLVSSNVSYTEADSIFQFDVTVQNLLPERMGTADGTALHANGIRVFFAAGPAPTGGSGLANVANPDGIATFTSTGQAYFQYDEILETNETSTPRTWRLKIEPTVSTFIFTIYVAAELEPLLVINEVMANPGGTVQDSVGEYVELYNAGRLPVDLNGFQLSDNAGSHVITASVIVPAGGHALLGRSPDQSKNGNISPDYVYATDATSSVLTFSNGGSDFFRIAAPTGVVIDSVAYSNAAIAAAAGTARELIDPSLDNTAIDGPNWASATTIYAPSNRGSPGAANVPPIALEAVPVATGLSQPVYLTSPPGDDRLFVVEQSGRVRIIEGGSLLSQPFLNLSGRISTGGERGLLSIAFHPEYAENGYFYVNYTATDGATQVERFTVSDNPNRADSLSAFPILRVPQPASNHNGGLLKFGPDGMLYIGMGDGGGSGDPNGYAQNLETLLGKILRIDVDSAEPYAIPSGNPYVGDGNARPEIWASGLRNPWRFSFDHTAGLLYIADVGQNFLEEINVVSASQSGVNYGWNRMEGTSCYQPSSGCNTAGLTMPVHVYPTDDGCAITGGYVYRGSAVPELRGTYFYSDYCSGKVSSFRFSGGAAIEHRDWNLGDLGNVSSFGEDADGELYIVDLGGTVYRLERP